MNIDRLHQLFLNSSGISTDTRKIRKDSIFFALKGENFNANEFAAEALEKGALYAVIDEDLPNEDKRLLQVEDSLKALQQLASFHRKHLGLPILALTGSNGKTTTKELFNAVLSKRYRTVATTGNLNNHIGVPITLLSMNEKTEIGIVEMGANHQKEIEFLCSLAMPDYGYITNFGKAHLEGFGSVEGVIKGKKELYDHLKEHKKLLFLNLDDPLQKEETSYPHVFSFGSSEKADVTLKYFREDSYAGIEVEGAKICGKLTGAYNGTNMAAAYTVGTYFEIPSLEITAAIKEYSPQNNRSQIILKNNRRIILDAYNANPSSMAAALENLSGMDGSPKIAILGDMFELGPEAKKEHQQLLDDYSTSPVDKVYAIGSNFSQTETTSQKIKKFESFEAFRAWFQPSEFNAGTILIKGSRGMALERVMELI
ncbi:UDP-N-acetylmuramoyl-tripeptide--D-alanyl-D-alanine ligase [Salinimicrobium sediminilitoris]|uniref:UDP-N-acetylmuramoyl-tripeptide--D-alanyl-D- alanine ligase n=1 Tax=Salinimicrobium sediminilitoris TaxID=2876715 RepID=UPI001E32F3FB|nr:UDP-N-acetylmuramoyl-tripeptide--D-alanyl-D-alanine ligase [Salinimicrobium sediminilitoris]MCC8360888.1 UDP-N-acetylmuramoyl-tripeptide--D-alanyl-D-alanine ligase [Salinimicrobium sediminilitoris]